MAKKDKFIASPLFDAHKTFVRLPMGLSMLAEYPDSKQFLESITHSIPEAQQDFIHTQAFLKVTVAKAKLPIAVIAMKLNAYYYGHGR